jgi:apolipoprotein N-acyltransferase
MLGTALLCVPYLGPLLAWVALLPLLHAWRQAHGSGRLLAASVLAMAVAQSTALGYFAPLNPAAVAVLLLVQSAVASIPWLLLALLRRFAGIDKERLLWLLPGLWLGNDWAWAQVPQIVPTPLGGALGPWLPSIQFYELTGLAGGTLLLLLLQIGLLQTHYPRRRRLLAAAAVVALVNAHGGWQLWHSDQDGEHDTTSVALIRSGAYRPGDDLYPFFDRLMVLSAQAARAGAQLLVWPESTLPPELIADTQEPLNRVLHAIPARHGVPLLFGYDEGAGRFLYNSAGLLTPEKAGPASDIEQRYRKRWLLPAEEGRYFFGLGKQHMLGGDSSQPLSYRAQHGASRAIGPLICYEVLIPAAAVAQVRAGAQALLVLANDQDFWLSPARWQLDAQSRVRAVETRRSLLRAASTGALYQLDAYGRQVQRDDGSAPAFLIAQPALRDDLSLYVRYPDWLPLLAMLDSLIALLLLFLQGRRPLLRPLATIPAER